MITNETEIRIAVQAVLVSVLALTGYWGCAVLVFCLLVPWKPIFAVGGYLAQPVVDWRAQKARDRHDTGLAQLEKQLDALLCAPKIPYGTTPIGPTSNTRVTAKNVRPEIPGLLKSFRPQAFPAQTFNKMPDSAQDLAATLAIPPAIKNHVRNLPQGVFSNMDIEVEDVKFQGDSADAHVRFKSPHVSGLVIRQCYRLRKIGDHWVVQSRKPANGAGRPFLPLPAKGLGNHANAASGELRAS